MLKTAKIFPRINSEKAAISLRVLMFVPSLFNLSLTNQSLPAVPCKSRVRNDFRFLFSDFRVCALEDRKIVNARSQG